MKNLAGLIRSLQRFGETLPRLVAEVGPDDASWRPADGAWSILEIVCHLCDEEQFDFRARVKSTLLSPDAPWSPIDPPAWAVERKYNERELSAEAARFQQLRRESIDWLQSLSEPNWNSTYHHPKLGAMTAGEIFAAWAAHDQLHLRQIAKRQYQLVERDAVPFSLKYAGDW